MTRAGETRFASPRVASRHTHGTGCTLASACAAGLAQGLPLVDAVRRAHAYTAEAIRRAPGVRRRPPWGRSTDDHQAGKRFGRLDRRRRVGFRIARLLRRPRGALAGDRRDRRFKETGSASVDRRRLCGRTVQGQSGLYRRAARRLARNRLDAESSSGEQPSGDCFSPQDGRPQRASVCAGSRRLYWRCRYAATPPWPAGMSCSRSLVSTRAA